MRDTMRDDKTIMLGVMAAGISCAIVFGGIVLAIVGTNRPGTSGQHSALVTVAERKPPPPSTRGVRKWYEGGTLHKAKMSDWVRASRDDKLATAADFVGAYLRKKGMRDEEIDLERVLRPRAEDLVRQIDDAGKEPTTHTLGVSEVAAAIFVLQEKEKEKEKEK